MLPIDPVVFLPTSHDSPRPTAYRLPHEKETLLQALCRLQQRNFCLFAPFSAACNSSTRQCQEPGTKIIRPRPLLRDCLQKKHTFAPRGSPARRYVMPSTVPYSVVHSLPKSTVRDPPRHVRIYAWREHQGASLERLLLFDV